MLRLQAVSSYRFLVYWHFWAGVLISPILMVVAGSGLVMLFQTELESHWYRDTLVDVRAGEAGRTADRNPEPHAELFSERIHAGYFQQVITIAQRDLPPHFRIARMELEQRRGWFPSVLVAPIDKPWPQHRIYVDVDRQRTTGSLPETNLFTTALTLHRTLFAGWTGRIAVEFTASWLIASTLMGVRLWWQTVRTRRKRSSAVAHPPPAAASHFESVVLTTARPPYWTRFRNAHAWSGLLISPIVILIAWNGLQFAEIYGTLYHGLARATGQYDYLLVRPKSQPAPPMPSALPAPQANSDLEALPAPAPGAKSKELELDSILQSARTHGMSWQRVAIQMPSSPEDHYMIESGGDLPPSMTQTLYLDQRTGTLLKRYELRDLGPLAQWNKWSYPVHVGSLGGIWTKCLWGLVVLVLASMPVTASGMVLVRSLRGQRLFPKRVPVGSWRSMAFLVAISLLLPTVGLSVLAAGAASWLTVPMRRARRPGRKPTRQ